MVMGAHFSSFQSLSRPVDRGFSRRHDPACQKLSLSHCRHNVPSSPSRVAGVLFMTKYVVKEFDVMSVAKFFAVLGLVWGFLMGLFVAFGAGAMAAAMGAAALGAGMGIAGLFFMVIIGGIGGFVGGAIIAVIYNLVLGVIGGIVVDLEAKQ